MLKIKEVTVYVDLSKSQIIEQLDVLEFRADRFEEIKSAKDLLTVAIINVGFFLDLEHDENHKIYAE